MGCACSSNRVHPVSTERAQEVSPSVTKLRAVRRVFAPVIPSFRCQSIQKAAQADTENVPKSPDELWSIIERRCQLVKRTRVQRDRAWKTIHVYVASTFSDFHDVSVASLCSCTMIKLVNSTTFSFHECILLGACSIGLTGKLYVSIIVLAFIILWIITH